jgi:protocatechuate 3,4-dioxygenase beta subunit
MKNITNRRNFFAQLGAAGLASAFMRVPGAFAQALITTPEQTEGPYYPITLPLDTDNDLLVINSSITPAVGMIAYLSGKILDSSGSPIRDAHVEIWHADNTGAYIHPSSMGYAARDQNFQGFGRFLTGSTGEYLFRTIVPGLYTGRTRHIHMKVKVAGRQDLTTQVYFEGEPQNSSDMVLQGIQNA